MLALLFIASFLYYRQTTELANDKIKVMAEKNISQTAGLFTLLLEGYDSVTKSLSTNSELLRLLKDGETQENPVVKVINDRTISNIVGSIFYSRDDIIGIHIITGTGRIHSYERRFAGVVNIEYRSSDWYRRLEASAGEMVWYGLSQGSVMNDLVEDSVFVFGRRLYDLTSYKPIGFIVLETEPGEILSALSNVTISPNSQVYIVNKSNEVIATTNAAENGVPGFDFQSLPRPVGKEVIADYRTDRLVVAANAGLADWTVIGITPKADLASDIIQIQRTMMVVVLLLIALSTGIATLVSRTISSPLKLLIREMKQVELGNFKGAVNVKSFSEINSLVVSFNLMVHRIEELIDRITTASISEKNAQLHALQSQVNPHFLYNTLDMIYWMLDERENDRLGRVILSLSQMFRYSSDWEDASRTTLRKELEQMRHYMTIIESRMQGRVRASIEMEERWLETVLPKMTIQPIIENAVKSGLEPLDREGTLRVYAEVAKQELHIVIEDDGIGIEDEALQRLVDGLDEKETSSAEAGAGRRGIGLPNVHRRIVLMYGDRYGLRFESKQGEGTTVTIAIPLPREEETRL
ncbi:sensor histidine kinase [Paenibacillus sp. TRM 82003]|nr:sensor histidine kinase [Paenibacillus sp. TRM 82003]